LSYIEAQAPNQRAWIEATGSEFRVDYWRNPGEATPNSCSTARRWGGEGMSANFPQMASGALSGCGPRCAPSAGDSDARFRPRANSWCSVEKSAPGVVYSALGWWARRAESLLKCREETFNAQISQRAADLVIMVTGPMSPAGRTLMRTPMPPRSPPSSRASIAPAPSALVILLTPPDRGDNGPRQRSIFRRC